MRIKEAFVIFLLFCLAFLFSAFNKAYAASVTNYYGSVPAGATSVASSFCSGGLQQCWNSWASGQTDCPSNNPQPCNGGSTWQKYEFEGCYEDPDSPPGNIRYINNLTSSSNVCSTGDKYSSSNPPVMNAGICNASGGVCNIGGAYKTCCNGTTPVSASIINTSPPNDFLAPPEAGCGGYSTVRCDGPGQPACGQPACNTLAPAATATTAPAATATSAPSCSADWNVTCCNGDTDYLCDQGAFDNYNQWASQACSIGTRGGYGTCSQPTATPGPTATTAPTATNAPMGPTPAPYIKVGMRPDGDYDFAAKPDNITISKTVGENFSLSLQFWNGNNEINEISTKGIGDLTIRWTLPPTLETVGSVVKGDGSPDSGCTVGSQDVSCPLYTGGTFNAGAFDQRKILVRVKTGTPAGTSITIPRATVIFTTDSNPHYPITGRNPGNNWGRNFPCDNCATNFFGDWTFSSNNVTVNVTGVCPGAPSLASMSPNSNSECATSAILSWDRVPNATHYDIRVDDGTTGTSASGPRANDCSPHDICINTWTASNAGCATGTARCTMTINVSRDKTYSWWIHAGAGVCPGSPSSGNATFSTLCATPTPVPGTISGNVTDPVGNLYLLPNAKVCLDPNAGPPYCTTGKIIANVVNGSYLFPSPPQVNHRVFLDPASIASNYSITGENSVFTTFGTPNANKFNPETVNFTVVQSTPTPTPLPTTGPVGVQCATTCATTSTVSFTLGFNSVSGATTYDAYLFQDSTSVNPVYSQTGRSPGAPSAFDGTQAHNRTYICRVVARNASGIVRTEDKTITAPDCTAPTPTPTSAPACPNDPPNSGCIIGDPTAIGCRYGTSTQNVWCQTINNNPQYVCRVCPPPPPPPMCNVLEPVNEKPTVTRPDEHTVDISMNYSVGGGGSIDRNPLLSPLDTFAKTKKEPFKTFLSIFQTRAIAQSPVPAVRANIYRSKTQGFITSGGGEKVAEQFGLHGVSFDTFWSSVSQRQVYYYQAEAKSGNIATQSATLGVIVNKGSRRDCGVLFDSNPYITNITQIASTATTADIEITFQFSYPFGGSSATPSPNPVPYLQFIGSSGQPAFIPGNAYIGTPTGRCLGDCRQSSAEWKYVYRIDLPPNTTDTFAVSGYQGEWCSQDAQIGSRLVTLSTNGGTAPQPKQPNLSMVMGENQNGNVYAKSSWTNTERGEKVSIYRSQVRWPQENSLSTTRVYDPATYSYTFTATDDLNNLTPGKYYYSVLLDRYGQTGFCDARYAPTAQYEVDWKGFEISGSVFLDTNKSLDSQGRKDPGEASYIGDLTVTLQDVTTGKNVDTYRCEPTTTAPCSGNYTLHGGAGRYKVILKVPDGYSPNYPIPVAGAPQYEVTTGTSPICTNISPASKDVASPCVNGNIRGANFAIISYPWLQGAGGDIRLDSGITNKIPDAPTLSGIRYVSLPRTGETSGIIYSGGSEPDFGQTSGSAKDLASIEKWLVYGKGGKFATEKTNTIRTSYQSMVQKLKNNHTDLKKYCDGDLDTTTEGTLVNCTLPNDLPNGIYTASYNTRLVSLANRYTFGAGKHYVFLIDGDLFLDEEILVPNGSTATFSVSGNITINKNIGTKIYNQSCVLPVLQSRTSTNCHIEGFYSADGDIIIEGNNGNCPTIADNDRRLNISGSLVSNAGMRKLADGEKSFQQNRDLCSDATGSNNAKGPAVTILERPDFILNAPEFLKVPTYTWEEVAP